MKANATPIHTDFFLSQPTFIYSQQINYVDETRKLFSYIVEEDSTFSKRVGQTLDKTMEQFTRVFEMAEMSKKLGSFKQHFALFV